MLFWAPLSLTVGFALWSYWPARDAVTGWGSDPLLSVWTQELVWHQLATQPLFSREFWWAPLFGGADLGLAYSENQIYSALVFWPLRLLLGNGALVLGIAAVLMTVAAFFCCGAWLRAVGVTRLCWWGGLLFACCGWIQSQYAHNQNLCIFLLPLALRAWAAFEQRPTPWRAVVCGAAFGWIGGWNLHFQVFAFGCLAALVLLRRRGFLALALAAAMQAPIALRYAQLSAVLGSYRSLSTYGASWLSFLGSGSRPRLILPSFEVGIEAAGYLGVPWLVLCFLSLRRPASRRWLLAAAFAFWVALGSGWGLFDALSLLPGIGALRATGRAQVLVMMFTLPAVLGFLETASFRFAALWLVALDLLPASAPPRMRIDPALWGPPTPISAALGSSEPLLIWPEADPWAMLDLTQSWTPYFGGISSRVPPGEDLLRATHSLDDALALTKARRVLSRTPLHDAALTLVLCAPHLDLGQVCLYEAKPFSGPGLRIDRDAAWQPLASSWPAADLRALTAGALDARALDRCRLVRDERIFGLRFRHDMPLIGPAIEGVRFSPGDRILHMEARQAIFRLPHTSAVFEVSCR